MDIPKSQRTPWRELQVLRVKDGYSLTALGDAAGLSTSYLSILESGQRYPNPSIIRLLADVLNVPYSVLEPRSGFTPTHNPLATGDAA